MGYPVVLPLLMAAALLVGGVSPYLIYFAEELKPSSLWESQCSQKFLTWAVFLPCLPSLLWGSFLICLRKLENFFSWWVFLNQMSLSQTSLEELPQFWITFYWKGEDGEGSPYPPHKHLVTVSSQNSKCSRQEKIVGLFPRFVKIWALCQSLLYFSWFCPKKVIFS